MPVQVVPVRDDKIEEFTRQYLDQLNMQALPSTKDLKEALFTHTIDGLKTINAGIGQDDKEARMQLPTGLTEYQIFMVVSKICHVRRVACSTANSNPDLDVLAMYQEYGPDRGLYVDSTLELRKLIRSFNMDITARGIQNIIC